MELSILFRGFYIAAVGMAPALVLMGGMGRCNHVTHHITKSTCNPWQRLLRVITLFNLHPPPYTPTNQCLGCLQCNGLDLMSQESCAQHVALKRAGVEPHTSPVMKFRPDPACSQANPPTAMCGEDAGCCSSWATNS